MAAPALHSIGIGGLLRICDDTGILQHSIHSVPDRAHGYCGAPIELDEGWLVLTHGVRAMRK